MSLKVIHIVSSFDRINFGIWNAAIFGLGYLEKFHHVRSYMWSAAPPPAEKLYPPHLIIRWLDNNSTDAQIDRVLKQDDHDTNTIVVTHGSWLQPTKLGYRLSQRGFRWLYVPHGMLEPWSINQAALKKSLYYSFFEKRYIRSAKRVRAVSGVERDNLSNKLGRKIDLIQNGVIIPVSKPKSLEIETFLFLGRLHHKKGILPLVLAWSKSMSGRKDRRLIIAGPDQGELKKIRPYISGNIEFKGAVYGEKKENLLSQSHYFVLPSHSEGFPVSVLEAMSYGLIPLISKGCNFDEVFEQDLGYQVEPNEESIADVLANTVPQSFDAHRAQRNRDYVISRYSEQPIANRLFDLYNSM